MFGGHELSAPGAADELPVVVGLEGVAVGAERVELVEGGAVHVGVAEAVVDLHEALVVAADVAAQWVLELHGGFHGFGASVALRPRCTTLRTAVPSVRTSFTTASGHSSRTVATETGPMPAMSQSSPAMA